MDTRVASTNVLRSSDAIHLNLQEESPATLQRHSPKETSSKVSVCYTSMMDHLPLRQGKILRKDTFLCSNTLTVLGCKCTSAPSQNPPKQNASFPCPWSLKLTDAHMNCTRNRFLLFSPGTTQTEEI